MKRIWVRLAITARAVLDRRGVDRARAPRDGRWQIWAKSLVAIYDAPSLVALDVPWWTLDSADRVERFLAGRHQPRVFEWGSGASTVWLARRAAEVVSVEHDEAWAARISPHLPAGVRLRVVPTRPAAGSDAVRSARRGEEGRDFRSYVAAIDDEEGQFDLVVVDGRAREACLLRAVDRLADGGIVLLDNVDRERYRRALDGLGDRVEVEWTRGLTPALPYPTRTALVRLAVRR